ncbi:MAG: OmpA family protein [Blastocatellia bacterium]|nr:OmpA family protein [Blastocatellia bacterium]
MSDSPLRIVSNQPADAETPAGEAPRQDDLAELRRLLLEPEQMQLNNILERLNNPRVRAREMSRALTESVRLRTEQDESLTEALGPTIVTAFHHSIKKDPKPVADAISPLMGPAIRRYISMMLNGMVQSFDQALKYSLSWQGVKWRIEAMKTGKSFAEVVMLHTLVYRVEQVFLIHKTTSLKLAHVSADSIKAQDADIVSGMMNAMQEAIRSFARDSFGSAQDETIDTLDLGDREVWFESGPHAVLAVVIRGKAPENLRGEFFVPALEAIHVEMSETLQAFDGDDAPFELARPHLESCLQSQYQGRQDPARFRIPLYVHLLALLAILGLAAWAFFAWRGQRRWNGYLERLRSTPGIVITEEGTRHGKRYLAGLRDPLAPDPAALLRETAIDPGDVLSQWAPYQAMEKPFIEARAHQLLEPPPGVTLQFEDGVLRAQGAAADQWIVDARRFSRALPGVTRFDEKQLVVKEVVNLESRVLLFTAGTADLLAGQQQELPSLVAAIRQLDNSTFAAGRALRIEIIGHTDEEGTDATNQRLSETRAARTLSLLTARGIRRERLTTRGAASREPVRLLGDGEADKLINRSVSFKVLSIP